MEEDTETWLETWPDPFRPATIAELEERAKFDEQGPGSGLDVDVSFESMSDALEKSDALEEEGK